MVTRYSGQADREEIDLDCRIDELELDSLAMFEIVYELEECFAVELDEDDLDRITVVRDLVEQIEQKVAGKDGAGKA